MNWKLLNAIVILVPMLWLCCGGAEKKFEKSVAAYCETKSESDRSAALQFLMVVAEVRRFSSDVSADRGAVFRPGDGEKEFAWPLQRAIEPGEDMNFIGFDLASNAFVFSRKNEIAVFDDAGRKKISGKVGDAGDVLSAGFLNTKLYVLHGNRLLVHKEDGVFEPALNVPVFDEALSQKTHRALMIGLGNYIAINSGNAGAYRLSVVDVQAGRQVIKGTENASLRFGVWGDSVAYITGGSGNWTLMRMNIAGKETKVLHRFSALEDVAFAENYVCIIEKGKTRIGELGSEKFYDVPEGYLLSGAAGRNFLMKHNNAAYLLNAAMLYTGLQKIESCK